MYVTPARLYSLETLALAEQQQKLQVCENTEQLGSSNKKNKEIGQKKDERPEERGWDVMKPNRKIGEKRDEMGKPLGKNGCKQTSKEGRGGKTSRTQEKGRATVEMGGLREEGYEKIGEGWKMERGDGR